VRRDSDSSSGSAGGDKPPRKSKNEMDGGNSTEITPRVVQEVGAHPRRGSGSKDIRQKALLNSNDRNRKHSSGENKTRHAIIKTSASSASIPFDDRDSHVDDHRPVTSAERNCRTGSSNQRHDTSTNPDGRVIHNRPNVHAESFYDKHGTGFNEKLEEDGSWQCLKSSCGHITYDTSIDYCEMCATRRGASGERGDQARLSINR
jgi:hypothetical protein